MAPTLETMDVNFRRLFESAPDLYMVLAPDPPAFTIVAASEAYLRAVKRRRDELVGRPVFDALPVGPEDRSSMENSSASFRRAIESRRPDTMAVQRHDLVRPDAEGGGFETHYWSAVNTPVLSDDGTVLYVLHRVEDVTEFIALRQRGAEQEALAAALQSRAGEMEVEIYRRAQEIQAANRSLRDANDRLGELDRAKTVFFANVSHEFRTPLTLILGILDELLEDAPAERASGLRVARRNAQRLLKLVNALLDFSRHEAGRAAASYSPTDVGTFTAELASSFASACEGAGLRFVVDCPSTRASVWVDREMWARIVLNLVSNAFKFTLEGEIVVRVRETPEGVELTVADTGVGIPADELPRIFERFHRVPSVAGRSIEGTGIGLSLVQELVHQHGGDVQASSSPGRGSVFTVRIPAGTAHLPPDRVASEASAAESVPATHSAGAAQAFVDEAARWLTAAESGATGVAAREARPRVLVADDNADMREYVGRLLAGEYDVVFARDGQEALETAKRARPDLVLSDVMMPRVDGIGLVRGIRADPDLATVPLILLSARAGDDATAEGLATGADDYLAKPFSKRELAARVATHLALARLRTDVARAAERASALEDLDRRKNEFLAMLSHEMRNPLASIANGVFVLQRTTANGEQARRARDVLERQVAHLTRMVDDLLDMSRITQGKLQIARERLELNAVLRDAAEDSFGALEDKGLRLQLQLGPDPLWVTGDRTRLTQVVGNLLANAVKFTPPGGHVTLASRVEADEAAVVVVRDDGAGMPADLVQHLFEPFVQASQTLDRSAGGLGLGLAIVRGLVEAHGGTVLARSDGPGRGSELVVRLPLRQRASRDPDAGPDPRGRARRVLIIEDNDDAAESLKMVLELHGHQVEVAPDGESGISRALALHPEVVVSDIGLPRLDGYGVARALRADPATRSTCLVAVTGYAAFDDVQRSRDAGFDHHLAKPPDVDALERILADCSVGRPAAVG